MRNAPHLERRAGPGRPSRPSGALQRAGRGALKLMKDGPAGSLPPTCCRQGQRCCSPFHHPAPSRTPPHAPARRSALSLMMPSRLRAAGRGEVGGCGRWGSSRPAARAAAGWRRRAGPSFSHPAHPLGHRARRWQRHRPAQAPGGRRGVLACSKGGVQRTQQHGSGLAEDAGRCRSGATRRHVCAERTAAALSQRVRSAFTPPREVDPGLPCGAAVAEAAVGRINTRCPLTD